MGIGEREACRNMSLGMTDRFYLFGGGPILMEKDVMYWRNRSKEGDRERESWK